MITLSEWLRAVKYQIVDNAPWQLLPAGNGTSDFRLFNAFRDRSAEYVSNLIFNEETENATVIEFIDYNQSLAYRWINPVYRESNMELGVAGVEFIQLNDEEDIMEKITALFNGEEYDTRVTETLDLTEHEIYMLAMGAHKQDITLNEYIGKVLKAALEAANERE